MSEPKPCPCCQESRSLSQRAFLNSDQRLTRLDPAEAKARAKFGPALAQSQSAGSSISVGYAKPWSTRHGAVVSKLPVSVSKRGTVSQITKRVEASGRMVAKVK